MKTILQELTSKFSHNSDFIVEEELIDNTTVYLIGFQTLVDITKSKLYIQQIAASSISVKAFFTNISNQLNVNTEQLTKALLDGYLVILSKDETKMRLLILSLKHSEVALVNLIMKARFKPLSMHLEMI